MREIFNRRLIQRIVLAYFAIEILFVFVSSIYYDIWESDRVYQRLYFITHDLLVITIIIFLTARQYCKHIENFKSNIEKTLEKSGTGTWHWNLKTNQVFWDKFTLRILGMKSDDFGGHLSDFIQCIHPQDRAKSKTILGQAIKDGLLDAEFRVVTTPEHRIKYIAFKGAVSYDSDGQPDALSGVTWDITESKEIEEKFRQFAFVASHDLREPLKKIHTFSEMLREEQYDILSIGGQRCLDYIHRSADRLMNLVSDLLFFGEVENSKSDEVLHDVDMNEILEHVIEDLSFIIKSNDAKVVRDNDLPIIQASSHKIHRILKNLIHNAIKFRKKECSPVVHIGSQENNREWFFYVMDNGIGIPQDKEMEIFTPFYRYDSGMNGTFEPGSGLGLAICRRIVSNYGGLMCVDSKVGKGSAFYFTIPKRDA